MSTLNYRLVVNAGQLLLIDAAVSDPHVTDVLNSLLYAQLAASFEGPRFIDEPRWSAREYEAQKSFGWSFPVESSDVAITQSSRLNVASMLANALPSLKGQAEQERLHARLDRLDRTTPGMELLAASTCLQKSAKTSAQVFCTLVVVSPGPVLEIASVSFGTGQALPDLWSGYFDSRQVQGKVKLAMRVGRLQEMVYASMRDTFTVALKDDIPTHVFNLDKA